MVARIIMSVLSGGDHRDIVVDIIDAAFVSEAISFFEQVVRAKVNAQTISVDWYRKHFLREGIDKQDFATNGGLNMKTIENKHKSTRRELVIDEALQHYEKFVDLVESLCDSDISVDLSITFRDVTVHLDLNESLIVINALAVKRAAIRGGMWSTVGKQVERPLMEVLCRLFDVPERYFTRTVEEDDSIREIDFYLLPPDGSNARCEVKLMGKGNPESLDSVFANKSKVAVVSTLSQTNITQLNENDILWTQLQVSNGFLRFQRTLAALGLPHKKLQQGPDHRPRIITAIERTLGVAVPSD